MSRNLLKHGLSYTPEYRAWQTMRLRCTNPKNAAYPDYGGRGIKVCRRWLNDPAAFVADMGKKPSPRHELDRRNNNKGYSPSNCRWVLRPVNCRNRRSNRWVEAFGERRTLIEWAEVRGIPADTIKFRLEAGWSAEKALSTPARAKLGNGKRVALDAAKREHIAATRKLPPGVKAKRGKFIARTRFGGREQFLGSFDTPEQAAAAYRAARANFAHELKKQKARAA